MVAVTRPDVILSDVRMPGIGGLELLRFVRARTPDIGFVLMTAFDDLPLVATAMREGAADFLVKPLDLHVTRRLIDAIFDDRAARRNARSAGPATDGTADRTSVPIAAERTLVGRDARMIEVFKLVGQAAASRANVMIRGESGTGKELVARAIHATSADAAEPFVAVNCAALPSTLLESELFGHVRGSFTGATADRKGRFAHAGRGTIFLDEIGDTSPEFQAKLLRVLQEREFYPVGADRPSRTDARVITATHCDLEHMVSAGSFRQDLYYRLHVVEIVLPALRERAADIPLLAAHLVQRIARAAGRAQPVIAADAVERLMAQRWPGNVRELENCLTRAMVRATGDVIRAEHVMPAPASAIDEGRLSSLEAMEREHVIRMLKAANGEKARAARILGVSRPRLDRLLRKFGLESSG